MLWSHIEKLKKLKSLWKIVWFYHKPDKEKTKKYSPIRQKLLNSQNKIIEIDGIKVYPIHCISNRLGLYCPSASKIARQIIKNYDVVYATNWYYHIAMVFSGFASHVSSVICPPSIMDFISSCRLLNMWAKSVLCAGFSL